MGFGYVSRNHTMRPTETTLRSRVTALLLATLLCGCASSGSKESQEPAPAANPLAGLVGSRIVVLPAQLISTAAPGGSWDVQPQHASLLKLIDQEIADAFRKRGVRNNWTFAEELIASATRNAGLAGNPLALPVAGIRRIKAGDTPLPEPLASQIRTLVSLTSARFVIMPLEMKVDMNGGQRKGSLRVLLIDSRTARVTWAGDVDGVSTRDATTVADTFTPFGFRGLARELAGLFAEMVVPG
jgi:hypothetical protein